jgi:hypothetical protein
MATDLEPHRDARTTAAGHTILSGTKRDYIIRPYPGENRPALSFIWYLDAIVLSHIGTEQVVLDAHLDTFRAGLEESSGLKSDPNLEEREIAFSEALEHSTRIG